MDLAEDYLQSTEFRGIMDSLFKSKTLSIVSRERIKMDFIDITVLTCAMISMAFAFSSLMSEELFQAIFYAVFTLVILLVMVIYKIGDIYYELKYPKRK